MPPPFFVTDVIFPDSFAAKLPLPAATAEFNFHPRRQAAFRIEHRQRRAPAGEQLACQHDARARRILRRGRCACKKAQRHNQREN